MSQTITLIKRKKKKKRYYYHKIIIYRGCFAGIRKASGAHADQVLRVPSRRPGLVRRAQVRAAGRRRGVRRAHRHRVAVHTHRRRAQVPQLVGVAPREPDADRRRPAAGRYSDDTRTDTRGRGRGGRQGDEHVLQLAVGRRRRGRGSAQRRPLQPTGSGARGQVAPGQLHRVGVRRRRRRRKRPNRLVS